MTHRAEAQVKHWKKKAAGIAVLAALATTAATSLSWADGARAAARPKTGVGSCTLIGWNPSTDPKNAKDLPVG